MIRFLRAELEIDVDLITFSGRERIKQSSPVAVIGDTVGSVDDGFPACGLDIAERADLEDETVAEIFKILSAEFEE